MSSEPSSAPVLQRLASARNRFAQPFSMERAERVAAKIERRIACRRNMKKWALKSLATSLLLVGVVVVVVRANVGQTSDTATAAQASLSNTLRFFDGSTAEMLEPDTDLSPILLKDAEVVSHLNKGAVRFHVTEQQNRIFKVVAGQIEIEVLGTIFTVHSDAKGVRVEVVKGRVRVTSPAGRKVLNRGESATFAHEPAHLEIPSERQRHTSPEGDISNSPESVPPKASTQPPVPAASWQSLAEQKLFEASYRAWQQLSATDKPSDPSSLLLAADVARQSHHSAAAVPPLKQLLAQHPHDARAPIAAFTLGRVLLHELGRPEQAAQAFAKAQRLAPSHPLAEDAKAREVEAWSRSGHAARARRVAEEYLTLYPSGRWSALVRRHGGLE